MRNLRSLTSKVIPVIHTWPPQKDLVAFLRPMTRKMRDKPLLSSSTSRRRRRKKKMKQSKMSKSLPCTRPAILENMSRCHWGLVSRSVKEVRLQSHLQTRSLSAILRIVLTRAKSAQMIVKFSMQL